MRLITRIEIRNFRSIEHAIVDSVGNLTTLVGKNSSGKSNVLRALNLFFNNEVDIGQPPELSRDHHFNPKARKKKQIAVSLGFRLPPRFKYRKELTHLADHGDQFTITRFWELDERRNITDYLELESNGSAIADGDERARQFLSLLNYRYVPVRGVPSALLREESKAIADSVFFRMKGDKHASALLDALTAAAKRMLTTANASLQDVGAPLTDPSLATSSTLGEMLTMTGFQASGPLGGTFRDEDWGAGHQAFFLYLVLHTIDTSYSRFFGWRQATIWGIEEPESTLHRDLETRLAQQLREWALEEKSRLQILATSHSPIFSMAADEGVWVEMQGSSSGVEHVRIPELTNRAESAGVSGWIHPALSFPWNPVVLVEGSIDQDVLTHVSLLAGYGHLRFLTLPKLDTREGGAGKDSMITYLRRYSAVIANRPRSAPLIALFDWEVSKQDMKKARVAYGPMGDQYVAKMDATHCHPKLGEDFSGIERFYPPDAVLEAHYAGELILGIGSGDAPYSISSEQLNRGKGALRNRVIQVRDLVALAPLMKVIADVDHLVTGGRWVQGELEVESNSA